MSGTFRIIDLKMPVTESVLWAPEGYSVGDVRIDGVLQEKEILAEVRSGKLSAGHARELAGIHDPEDRKALFRRALNEHLSVRQLEMLAADLAAGVRVQPRKQAPKSLSLELRDMQERLRTAVGVQRVTIQGGDKRGKVILSYRSAEELDLIYAALETLEGR